MRNVPRKLKLLNTWSQVGGVLDAAALLEKARPCASRVHSPVLLPFQHLCFTFYDCRWNNGLSASCSGPFLADTASLPQLTLPLNDQPKEILLEVALVMVSYHSNRKVTNTPGNERTPLAARNTTKVLLTFNQHGKDTYKIDREA